LGEWSYVFDYEVLPLLDPTTRALLGRVGQACRDAMLRSPQLPCAGQTVGVKFKIKEFVGSCKLLAWAHANGCPWETSTCAFPPLGTGSWRRCNGRGNTAARGMRVRVQPPLGLGTWWC